MKKVFAWFGNLKLSNWILGVLLLAALFGFEVFNFSTTKYALKDTLGDLRFAGLLWATILAVAFCGIDFAGVARIFTPALSGEEPIWKWYFMGGWALVAAFNAMLTGWAVLLVTHILSISIFVAFVTWVVRLLIVGVFVVAGDKVFNINTVRQPFVHKRM